MSDEVFSKKADNKFQHKYERQSKARKLRNFANKIISPRGRRMFSVNKLNRSAVLKIQLL